MVQSAGGSGVQAWGGLGAGASVRGKGSVYVFTRSNTHIENIGRPQSRNNRKSRNICFLAIIVRIVIIAIEIIVIGVKEWYSCFCDEDGR